MHREVLALCKKIIKKICDLKIIPHNVDRGKRFYLINFVTNSIKKGFSWSIKVVKIILN